MAVPFGVWGALLVPAVALLPVLQYERCCSRRAGSVDGSPGSAAHHWPSSMGHAGSYGSSRHAGPRNLTEAFSWSWSDPKGRFKCAGFGGTVIDRDRNIYLARSPEVMKFSPDGRVLWSYTHEVCYKGHGEAVMANAPALWGDAYFGATEQGALFALNASTGGEIWSVTYVPMRLTAAKMRHGFFNNGFVQVGEGVVVVDGMDAVYGIDAADGRQLWTFKPDGWLWNFKADFALDGTFVFQTWEGEAYRCRVRDGSLVWKAGGEHGTWTDGNIALGPNNIVYAVNTKWPGTGPQPTRFEVGTIFKGERGRLTAYDLAGGRRLWARDFDKPPNNAPAVGRLGPGAGYSVVQAIGQQDRQGERYTVHALDAATGAPQWTFEGPVQEGLRLASGDLSPEEQAALTGVWVPNPWSAPTIDAAGVVYIGNQEGPIFALRDADGDGRVRGAAEVDSFDTRAGFDGSEAPSIAPGLMAVASMDTLYVFRY